MVHAIHQGTFDHTECILIFLEGFFGIGIDELGNAFD